MIREMDTRFVRALFPGVKSDDGCKLVDTPVVRNNVRCRYCQLFAEFLLVPSHLHEKVVE